MRVLGLKVQEDGGRLAAARSILGLARIALPTAVRAEQILETHEF